jgi:hypothetical protein
MWRGPYLSPLALRAFTPVFDGLWRGRVSQRVRPPAGPMTGSASEGEGGLSASLSL